jgi:hypothetical protein
MPYVELTRDAVDVIVFAAGGRVSPNAEVRPDGSARWWLDDGTYARLESHRRGDETPSDVILRIALSDAHDRRH